MTHFWGYMTLCKHRTLRCNMYPTMQRSSKAVQGSSGVAISLLQINCKHSSESKKVISYFQKC